MRLVSSGTRRIGIPRSLLYHRYSRLWPEFIRDAGHEPVLSPPTDQSILDDGCRLAPDEACLPVKLHLGHVARLLDTCDTVLLPRIVSLGRREENCAKFMGTYDVAANVFPDAPFATFSVDVRGGERERPALVGLGVSLGARPLAAGLAYERAHALQLMDDARAAREEWRRLREDGEPKVLAVAHSYNLADDFLGGRAVRMLAEQGVRVISAEALHVRPRRNRTALARDAYWTYSRELLAALESARPLVDGILFVMTFPCGPDSLVTELCTLRIRDVPLTSLVIDEHTSDVGVRTRMECFADIVRSRAERRRARSAEAGR